MSPAAASGTRGAVLVTRNDAGLGVFNGDIGITLAAAGGGLRVYFADGPRLRSIGVGHLAHVETAYAMTVHKAQGSEFRHAVLVLPPEQSAVATRELVYTGVTRAAEGVHARVVARRRAGRCDRSDDPTVERPVGLHRRGLNRRGDPAFTCGPNCVIIVVREDRE